MRAPFALDSPARSRSAPRRSTPVLASGRKDEAAPRRNAAPCACGGGCPRCGDKRILPKLANAAVSQPHEPVEREADRMAERALRAQPGTAAQTAPRPGVEALAGRGDELAPAGGRPLDRGARTDMERRFGADLGAVRIHTGDDAAYAAAHHGALAYTAGRNIVFGAGQYAPASAAGRRLLAHELAHVTQQSAPGAAPTARVLRAPTPDDTQAGTQTGTQSGAQAGTSPKTTVVVVDNLGCPKEKCAGKEEAIRADLRRALSYTTQALAALDGKLSTRTEQLLDWYFKSHADVTAKTVRERLACTLTALQETLDNDHFGCGTREGAHAHTGGSDTLCQDSGAPVCLDPSYFTELSSRERAEALVHECGHRMGLSTHASGTPDIYSVEWRFIELSTAQALGTTEAYAKFVGAIALGAPTTIMPFLGVAGGAASQGAGWFLNVHGGVEVQHPRLRGINPRAAVSFAFQNSEITANILAGVRFANPRPGKSGGVYLGVSGELSFIFGDKFAVGGGAQAELGYRIGRFDIGLTGEVIRDPTPSSGARTELLGGLSLSVTPDFFNK